MVIYDIRFKIYEYNLSTAHTFEMLPDKYGTGSMSGMDIDYPDI